MVSWQIRSDFIENGTSVKCHYQNANWEFVCRRKNFRLDFFCFSYLAKIIGWFHISDICRLFSFAACNSIYHLEFYDLSISSDLMENSSDLSPRRIFRISKIAHAKLFHCVRLFIREFLNNQRQQSYQSFELFQFFFLRSLSPFLASGGTTETHVQYEQHWMSVADGHWNVWLKESEKVEPSWAQTQRK